MAAECACTAEAPCLVHFGELHPAERRNWQEALGIRSVAREEKPGPDHDKRHRRARRPQYEPDVMMPSWA